MISHFKRYFAFSVIALMVSATPVWAQDAGQVLRVSIGYINLKNSVKNLGPEKRTEVEKFGRMAKEATDAGKYGDALKYYYQAISLLRGSEWTPGAALSSALTLKAERVVIEPLSSLRLHLGQIFPLDEKVPMKMSGSVELLDMQGNESLKTLKTIELIETDFFAHPALVEFSVPEIEPGKYRLTFKLKSAATTQPITRTITVHIERGLVSSFTAAKDRLERIENKLQSTGKESIQTALRSVRYQIGLIDMANSGEISPERIDFMNELKEVNILLDELEAGRDPFAFRRGDFRKAYLSNVDHTLQPYRLFVPSSYDGSKPYPLIIALHGMSGDESRYPRAHARGTKNQNQTLIGVGPYRPSPDIEHIF